MPVNNQNNRIWDVIYLHIFKFLIKFNYLHDLEKWPRYTRNRSFYYLVKYFFKIFFYFRLLKNNLILKLNDKWKLKKRFRFD